MAIIVILGISAICAGLALRMYIHNPKTTPVEGPINFTAESYQKVIFFGAQKPDIYEDDYLSSYDAMKKVFAKNCKSFTITVYMTGKNFKYNHSGNINYAEGLKKFYTDENLDFIKRYQLNILRSGHIVYYSEYSGKIAVKFNDKMLYEETYQEIAHMSKSGEVLAVLVNLYSEELFVTKSILAPFPPDTGNTKTENSNDNLKDIPTEMPSAI